MEDVKDNMMDILVKLSIDGKFDDDYKMNLKDSTTIIRIKRAFSRTQNIDLACVKSKFKDNQTLKEIGLKNNVLKLDVIKKTPSPTMKIKHNGKIIEIEASKNDSPEQIKEKIKKATGLEVTKLLLNKEEFKQKETPASDTLAKKTPKKIATKSSSKKTSVEFTPGEIVDGKLPGHSLATGRIAMLTEIAEKERKAKKNTNELVYFFLTDNYGFITHKNLKRRTLKELQNDYATISDPDKKGILSICINAVQYCSSKDFSFPVFKEKEKKETKKRKRNSDPPIPSKKRKITEQIGTNPKKENYSNEGIKNANLLDPTVLRKRRFQMKFARKLALAPPI